MRECLLIPILRFLTFLSAMHVLWPLLTETANPPVNEALRLPTGSSPYTSCAVLPGPYLVRTRKIHSPVLGH